MDHIVPRWEWRTFGQEFGPAEPRFAALVSEKVQKSDEVYLIAAGSDANVKIRDRLLDVKLLDSVDSHGLEQWRPVLKEPFPLAAALVGRIRAALGLPHNMFACANLELHQLLTELAVAGGPVRVVNVAKTRTRYHAHGCVAELTDVVADDKKTRTVAIEDQDPTKVIAAVRAMGLDSYPNISYPRGLRQLIGMSL
jgi:exopolyphosphatase / guanosine-5'-triphosphate,3'-diphosphate pyrophosphatase